MALDTCHEQVVRALEKDGWRVEKKPVNVTIENRRVYIDIRAHREMNGHLQPILLVEVKCFPDRQSTTEDLYGAIGQYIVYRAMLKGIESDVPLYLAIPEDVFDIVFDALIRKELHDTNIQLVIVNLKTETITQWVR